MSKVLGVAMVFAVCPAPAMAQPAASGMPRGPALHPHDFNLADLASPASLNQVKVTPMQPVLPRNVDLRDFNPPAVQVELADRGPVLSVGAIGARFKDAPRLAHIAIGMDF